MKYLKVDDDFYEKLSFYAVFIPIIEVNGKDHILFEKRSELVRQPGEVSFPGGGLEEGENFKDAAIRETMEELLLEETDIEYLGYSSTILTSSNSYIKSFYGRINKNFDEIKYNKEVESIFTVDIDFLKTNPPVTYVCPYRLNFPQGFPFEKIPNGIDYKFVAGVSELSFYDTEPVIWGLTARLLKRFIESWCEDEKWYFTKNKRLCQ